MTTEIKDVLETFDRDTFDYLESNKNVIFNAIARNEDLPQPLHDYIENLHQQRAIIMKAIEDLEKISLMPE